MKNLFYTLSIAVFFCSCSSTSSNKSPQSFAESLVLIYQSKDVNEIENLVPTEDDLLAVQSSIDEGSAEKLDANLFKQTALRALNDTKEQYAADILDALERGIDFADVKYVDATISENERNNIKFAKATIYVEHNGEAFSIEVPRMMKIKGIWKLGDVPRAEF